MNLLDLSLSGSARSPRRASALVVGGAVALLVLVGLAFWLQGLARVPFEPVERPAPSSLTLALEAQHSLAESIDRAKASTLALQYEVGTSNVERRVATGVVVSDAGDVLTVRVDPPAGAARESIVALDAAGHHHVARWVAADPETGLTLLKVDAHDITPIAPAQRPATLGAEVFLIGNPYGLAHSVSRGHVAGLARRLEIGTHTLGGLIQIQAPLHPGDSGALLADLEGGWLGLVRGGLAVGKKDDNDLGFAIPAQDALWVADQLRQYGKVDRAFLGIKLSTDIPNVSAEISSVIAGSPAEQGGLLPGDRIVRIDQTPIATVSDLTDRLDRLRAGSEVAIELIRSMARKHLKLTTGPRPVDPPRASTSATPAQGTPTPSRADASPSNDLPGSNATTAPRLPREVLERIERLERQVDEYRKRDAVRDTRPTP